ncbi:hypothetical protein SGFS_084240 [Streptomyces graminofaciens]|jgi:hypothetical protein|uniref:Uncharacterized protein n=1 Tax=Streptomyces graminofaciens TaxID=68212 RepID=A0ABM7FK96_9ACTN|nr:hypothetical protein [Streptomyces graminofaciens]BBC37130.1 hypothetical protein SGFS_084240 [Streptomyces graminofaciens]
MTNTEVPGTAPLDLEIDLVALRGDCARMAVHWAAPAKVHTAPVSPSLILGVTVPARSARLVDAMSDYGD